MLRTIAPWAGSLALLLLLHCVRDDTLAHDSEPGERVRLSRAAAPLTPPGSDGAEGADVLRGPRESLASLSRGELWATWNTLRGDAYALDDVERFIEPGHGLVCDRASLVRHSGQAVRYRGALQVNPAFRDRLLRFEEVVRDVSLEIYGRSPTRIQHFGAYSCRPTRNRAQRLSEHALGNALDVAGFEFGPAKKAQPLPSDLPRALRSAFSVQVRKHWNRGEENTSSAAHARFLRELTSRLEERDDIFRVMIGPSQHDHADHFHFDMSPWHYVRL